MRHIILIVYIVNDLASINLLILSFCLHRVTEEHLGFLALLAAVATQALGLLVHP